MPGDKGKYNEHGNFAIIGEDGLEDEKVRNVRVEPDARALRVSNWVYDSDAMENVRMVQPVSSIDDLEEIAQNLYFKDQRMEYDSNGDPIYIGYHITMNAGTDETDWQIVRCDWTDRKCVRRRVQTTSWDNRTAGWT